LRRHWALGGLRAVGGQRTKEGDDRRGDSCLYKGQRVVKWTEGVEGTEGRRGDRGP
jgi:hypothetical protein